MVAGGLRSPRDRVDGDEKRVCAHCSTEYRCSGCDPVHAASRSATIGSNLPARHREALSNKSWFTPVLDDAKITGATFYTCRQTFYSWLAMAGASMKDLQEAAGHKTITMSARYAHPFSGAHAISRGQNRHYWTNSHQNSHQEVFNMVPGGGLEPPRRVSSCGF